MAAQPTDPLNVASNVEVAAELHSRADERIAGMDDAQLFTYIAEAVFLERRRARQARNRDVAESKEQHAIEQAALSVQSGREDMEAAVHSLVDLYAHEIHNRFSSRTYEFAAKLVPSALNRLLTSTGGSELTGGPVDAASRIVVAGPTEVLSRLSKTHTLVLAPTHVSNLDSPIIGSALHAAKLPPFIYGAGLNLFGNSAMAFFMSRLGAYTVDRRKKHGLYKDTLKDYSTAALARGCHSMFFPGGTRSRSGRIERRLKRGLLGTAISAWQEGLVAGAGHPDILVVPCTLTYSLVLEAETLIEDSLVEEGQSRYIITDDEFSQPRHLYHFTREVLGLDASIRVRFGHPLDLVGNPVDDEGHSLGPDGKVIDRNRYVCDRDGVVVRDPQRDRVYTQHLADELVRSYRRDSTAVSTHVAAFAAHQELCRANPRLDRFQLAHLSLVERVIDREALLCRIATIVESVNRLVRDERIHSALPDGDPKSAAHDILEAAIDRFGRFHSRRTLEAQDWQILVDARLAMYYSNRLTGYGLEDIP